jgi:hypothetical protein
LMRMLSYEIQETIFPVQVLPDPAGSENYDKNEIKNDLVTS